VNPNARLAPSAWISRIVGTAVLFAACAFAYALNPDYPLSKYLHKSWGNDSGLMSVRQLAQTPDGYLWLAGSGGLIRFDGVRFTTYARASGQSLDNCRALLVDPDGSLWVATFGGVIAHFQSGQFHSYASQDGLPSDYIHALYRDSQGVLWVGTRDAGIFRMVHGRFEKASLGIPGLISWILEDSHQSLWFATFGNGVFRLQNGRLASFTVKDGLPDNHVAGLYRDHSGRIWTFGSKGISSWNGTKFVTNPAVNSVVTYASSCVEDRDGNLWIASTSSGLFRMHAEQVTKMDASTGLSANFIDDVFEDKEGNIWVATDAGLDRLENSQVRTFTTRDGLFRKTEDFLWPIAPDRSAGVWVESSNHVARVSAGQFAAWTLALPPGSRAYSLLSLPDSGLLLGLDGGLKQWTPRHPILASVMEGLDVRSLWRARDGSLWIGTANRGLLHWKSYPRTQEDPEVVLPDRFITTLAEDPKGTIWAGSGGGGLYSIAGHQVQHFGLADGLPSSNILTVFVDRRGALWVGSAGGLSWFHDGHILTVNSEQGLRSDLVLAISDDSYGRLWILGHLGIGSIEEKSLQDWAAGQRREVNPVFYRSADGLPPWTIDRVFPNATKSIDGHLWFAFGVGVAEVTPPNPEALHQFPVVIEDVTIDGISHSNPSQVRIPSGARSVEIRYTALTLSNSDAIRFRYRMEGSDDTWVDADTRRIAIYNHLKPGPHKFAVEATSGDERWLASSPLLIEQIPFFYQTKSFLFVTSATVLFLVYLTYQLRMRVAVGRIKAGFEQRMDERIRIARELHDTLLQSFHGLMGQIQAARNMLPRKPEKAGQVLDEAILSTEQALAEGRDAIRDLRPEPVAQRDLPELLNAAGKELAIAQEGDGHSPAFRVTVEGEPRALPMMLQDEVYRIAREVIRNAFRHAAASRIEVEVHYDEDQLRLRIRDDGKGIDPEVVAAGGRQGHWGISGMRERAKRIGAQLDFWCEDGAGTEVQLTVPGSTAYEKRRNGHRFRFFRSKGSDERRY
jgi:signal transduction histidine kinase/ligand-binding sensor domain-containing protein